MCESIFGVIRAQETRLQRLVAAECRPISVKLYPNIEANVVVSERTDYVVVYIIY